MDEKRKKYRGYCIELDHWYYLFKKEEISKEAYKQRLENEIEKTKRYIKIIRHDLKLIEKENE